MSIQPVSRSARRSPNPRRRANRLVRIERVENLESRLVMDYAAAVLADNPVAFYRFNEASGTTLVDSAPNAGAQNGTYLGNPVFNQTGVATSATGTSVRFDPSDGNDSASVTGLPLAASFTVEMWVKSAVTPWNENGWFAAARPANGFIMHPLQGGNGWNAYVVDANGGFQQIGTHDPGAVITGWHQYVMTFDAPTATGTMYFDGAVVARAYLPAAQSRAPLTALNVTIAKDDTGASRWGNGSLDDSAFYNYALTQGQIQAHYLAAQATFITWTGAVDNNWSNAANWTGGNIPDQFFEVAVFQNAAPGTINLQGNNYLIGGVEFGNTAGSFNLSNGTLAMTAVTNSGTANNTISANINATSNFALASNNAGATLNLSGNLNLDTFDLSAAGAGNVNVSGNILAGASVSGRFVRVTNNNTGVNRSLQFGEMEVFNEGVAPDRTASLSNNEIKGDSFEAEVGNVAHGANTAPYNDVLDTGGNTYNRDGVLQASYTLDLGASQPIGTVRMWQRVDSCCQDRLANFTVEVLSDVGGSPGAVVASRNFGAQVATNSFGDVVFGTANHLTKNGSGTLTLSGANTYHGQTTVNDGTLVVGSSGALGGTGVGTSVTSGATLALQGNSIVPAGESLVLGTGPGLNSTLRNISGTNAFNGPIRLAGLDATLRSDAGTLTLGGNLAMGLSRLSVDGAGDLNIAGQISAGPAAKFISVLDNGLANRQLHVSEIEAFGVGVTPDNAGDLSSNEIAGTAGFFDSTSIAHGALSNLVNNVRDAGGNVHTLNPAVNAEMGISLPAATQVGSVRVWQRIDACCQDRLSNFSINLYADDGFGNIGSLVQSQSFQGIPFTEGFAHISLQNPTANKLVKYGTGTLTLSSATGNTYAGGTEIKGGKLLVSNTSGSATGSGNVQVGGNLEGRFIRVRADNAFNYEFAIAELEALFEGVASTSNGEVDAAAAVSTAYRGSSFESQVGSGGHGLVTSVYDGIRQVGGNTWDRVALNPEYVLDLGTNRELGAIRLWQRADGCCQERLQNFTVSILADNGAGLPGATLFSQNFPGQATTNSFAQVNVAIPDTTTGATFGGNGSVSGAVNVLPGNRLDPGLAVIPPGTVGTGNLNLSNNTQATFFYSAVSNDRVNVTGSVTIAANVSLSFQTDIGVNPTQNTALILINNDTEADPVVGTFSGAAEGLSVTINNRVFQLTYKYNATLSQENTGNDVALLVRNRVPTAAANGPYTINEGSSLILSAAGSADADLDTLNYRWDVDNDGDFDELITGVNPTVTPAQLAALGLGDGPQIGRTVRVEVSDNFGGSQIATSTLNINNVAPTSSISASSQQTVPGVAIDFDISALDPAIADMTAGFIFTVDFGDGNQYVSSGAEGQNGNSVILSHAYNAFGNYTVTVKARDKDNGTGPTVSTPITVSLVSQIGDDIVIGGLNNVNDKYAFTAARGGGVTLRYQASNSSKILSFGPMEPNAGGRFIIYSQSGNDTLTVPGSLAYDFEFHGGLGNDTANGGAGNDSFYGDEGNDSLRPGIGNDYVEGGDGNDAIDGGNDNDTLLGGEGLDKVLGNNGDDLLLGGNGNDSINGGAGTDQLFGEDGNDTLQGYTGSDVLVGGLGNDSGQGGTGNDILIGGEGADRLEGLAGDDILVGGTTIYDDPTDPANLQALSDLLAEWNGGDDYLTRLDNLRTGSGLTNGATLEWGVSALDDGITDRLLGGTDRDWFLAVLSDQTDRKFAEESLN